MKPSDSFSVRSLTKTDLERIRQGQLSGELRRLILGSGSIDVIISLVSPFFRSRRYFVPTYLHNRLPSNLKQYWDKMPISGLVFGLVLICIGVLDFLLPWIDIRIGKKYVTRGELLAKKKLLIWHLLKINGTKRKWIRVDAQFYRRVQTGDTLQVTRTFLRTRTIYSKVHNRNVHTRNCDNRMDREAK